MAKDDKKTALLAEDQNAEGTNFDAKEMLLDNAKKETKIRYNDRVEIKLLKDTIYQKKGKVYSPHKVKALAMVEQGIAELVK